MHTLSWHLGTVNAINISDIGLGHGAGGLVGSKIMSGKLKRLY
jgi:hypothetical protein